MSHVSGTLGERNLEVPSCQSLNNPRHRTVRWIRLVPVMNQDLRIRQDRPMSPDQRTHLFRPITVRWARGSCEPGCWLVGALPWATREGAVGPVRSGDQP